MIDDEVGLFVGGFDRKVDGLVVDITGMDVE
jgi:hypothetical protein